MTPKELDIIETRARAAKAHEYEEDTEGWSDLVDIQWFSGDSVSPKPVPKKCPLPRIGSKDWGWESYSTISIYGVSRPTHRSKLTRYSVYEGVNYCVVIDPDRHDGSRRIGSELSLRDAKTLAEARARRDWRKEQGKR